MEKIKTAVLGATGLVGQQFLRMLEDHPRFEVTTVMASERSAGRFMRDFHRHLPLSDSSLSRPVLQLDAGILVDAGVRVAFSALPADVAGEFECRLAQEGIYVFSNASSHRMESDVPLLVADVNPGHLGLVRVQKNKRGWQGAIITNPNCTATGLVTVLAPLVRRWPIVRVVVTTYQAISGAGYPGVPALDITANIIPFISGEEEKVERETKKILGEFRDQSVTDASFHVHASCARVPVRDGHLESILVEFKEDAPSSEEIAETMSSYFSTETRGLPTAPVRTIIVRREEDRPQPLLDAMAGDPERARGMAVTVGRIRTRGNFLRAFVLAHNTIRGAAGCSLLNAELAHRAGLL